MKKLIMVAVVAALVTAERSAQANFIIGPTTVAFTPQTGTGNLDITYSVDLTAALYTYTYVLTPVLAGDYLTSFTIGGNASPLFTSTMAITQSGGGTGSVGSNSVGWTWLLSQDVATATVAFTSQYGPGANTFTVNDNGTDWGSPPAIPAPVPEASTTLAGALMILPLGIGAFRALRKERMA